jgi:predicted ArsR family transcriptional regulator
MITQEVFLKHIKDLRKEDFAARVDNLKALQEVFGEQVIEIITAQEGRKAEQMWQAIAQQHGRNDIRGIQETLWKLVVELGVEFTVTETPDSAQFHVTRCPMAEMARELGESEWGYVIYCSVDPDIVAGFNPAMGFSRTHTLMQGHPYCDHFYYMKKVDGENPR